MRHLILPALLLIAPSLQAQVHDVAPYLIADRATEISLARSAAPKRISDSATVLVMTRQGYVEAAKGTNGFVCLVVRAFGGPQDTLAWANARVRAPHCLNAAAARTVLPEVKLRTALVMAGTPALEVIRRTDAAATQGELPRVVESGAMAYMLSPGQYLVDENPAWHPHVMFYFPGEDGATWGAGGMDAPVIFGGAATTTKAIVLLIPVTQWSDGTPYVTHTGSHSH